MSTFKWLWHLISNNCQGCKIFLCPQPLSLIVSPYQSLEKKCRLVFIQGPSNPFSSLSHNVSLPVSHTLCTTAVFTNQMNRCWTSNSPSKKIGLRQSFYDCYLKSKSLWSLGCFKQSILSYLQRVWLLHIAANDAIFFSFKVCLDSNWKQLSSALL